MGFKKYQPVLYNLMLPLVQKVHKSYEFIFGSILKLRICKQIVNKMVNIIFLEGSRAPSLTFLHQLKLVHLGLHLLL